MLQSKLIYFLVVFILSVCGTDYNEVEGVKRSAVCLVERIATANHITAEYEKVNVEQKNGTTHISCRLVLGTEKYTNNSTSLAKAKEKVAREAYALTKYNKPKLGNRTCIIHLPTMKSDISILQEYEHVIGENVTYSEAARNYNGTHQYTATLAGKSGLGIGYKKQVAKTMAATNLLNAIGRSSVIDAMTAKYNQSKYHNMEPTLRLHKIIRVTDLVGDGIYAKKNEISENQAGKPVKRIVAEVMANDYMATGTGATFEEARSNAAANLLRTMNFTVTYVPH